MPTTTEKPSHEAETRHRPDDETPPHTGLAPLLWVIAVLLGAYELVCWVLGRMLS